MPQQINLYNPAFEERRALLSAMGAAAGWMATAVLVAVAAGYLAITARSAEQTERGLAAQLAAAQADTQRLAGQVAARRHDAQIVEEIARLETEIKGREEIMNVLKSGRLGDTHGFSEQLKAFARQSFEGVWLTGLTIASAGHEVSVEGRALQAAYVPGYLKRLNGESAMQGHPFSELLIQEPAPDEGGKATVRPNYVEFRLATKRDPAAVPKAGTR
jgi:hypothetical protein